MSKNNKPLSVIPARRLCLAREAALAVLSEAKELDYAETLHFVQGDHKRSSRKRGGEDAGHFARQPPSMRAGSARVTQKGILAGIFLAGIFLVAPAFAVCTQNGTATSSSSAVVGSNDISGIEGRHYFMIQNTGTSNPMNVAIGTSNNATNKDLYLGPGASWVMTMQGLKMVPGGDVAVIAPSGNTTYSFCDW
jgi:hypothetical protein